MNKTFLKGLFFGILIAMSVSSFAATSVWTDKGDTVETHEVHKEQKIVLIYSTQFSKGNDWTFTIPYGWHVVAITDVGNGGSCLVLMEKN